MINNTKKNVSAIILAAGKSERMEFPKSLLKYNFEYTFIEKIAKEFFDFNCNEIIIITNERDYKNFISLELSFCKIIINRFLDLGRFYSVKLGISEFLKSNSEYFFIQNIDNPFINQDLLKLLYENKNINSYSAPYYNEKGGHPILISRKLGEVLEKKNENNTDLKKELSKFEKIKTETNDKNILTNINTKQLYNEYFNFEI